MKKPHPTLISKRRCLYGIACYPDGGIIVDGILMRLEQDLFWYVQAEGQIYSWLIAKSEGLDVYNTILDGMGVAQKMGPVDRDHKLVDAIRA